MPPIWWGAWDNAADANGNTAGAGLDAKWNKKPSLVIVNKPWWLNGYVTFASISSAFATVRSHGQIPILGWQTSSWSGTPSPALDNATIASGAHDSFLTTFAQGIAALGYPVGILLDEECNGSWEPWYDATGVSFVNMWRHVWTVFTNNGATNVSWFWDINGIPPGGSLTNWWPGSAYVDWAVMDMFNTTYTNGAPWLTFDQIVHGDGSNWGDTWDAITALDTSGKVQFGIGSMSSENRTQAGANNFAGRAAWIVDMFGVELPNGAGAARDYSKLKAVLWFNQNEPQAAPVNQQNWDISDDSNSQAAAQGPSGPGGCTYYVAGGSFLLPSGGKLVPYESTPQVSRFTNAILMTAPTNLVGYWRSNETAGVTINDFSGNARNGTYSGGFTLNQKRIIPATFDPSVLYDGVSGVASVPHNAAFSLPTTGSLTVMIVFNANALPGAGYAAPVGKAAVDGSHYEWAIRYTSAGGLETDIWNLSGATYSGASFTAGTIVVGIPYIVFLIANQATSPIMQVAYAALGSPSMNLANSVDTLANTPAVGTAPITIGQRGDNAQWANAYVSHVAVWNIALGAISLREILAASTRARHRPANHVG